MPTSTSQLSTSDGPMGTEIFTPDGAGPWPAIIFCIDGIGPRPVLSEMAARIAKDGFVVALPDLFHRTGKVSDLVPADAPTPWVVFGDETLRNKFMATFYVGATAYDHIKTDIGAVLAHLHGRKDVSPGPVGVTGYCMGGNIAIRIATLFGDQIAATGSFHPGGLVTPAPDSPHRRVDTIKSRLYIGPATGDLPAEAQHELDAALTAAHVEHTIEQYPAGHGYAVSDNPSYDKAQSERHFAALTKLFAPLKHAAAAH